MARFADVVLICDTECYEPVRKRRRMAEGGSVCAQTEKTGRVPVLNMPIPKQVDDYRMYKTMSFWRLCTTMTEKEKQLLAAECGFLEYLHSCILVVNFNVLLGNACFGGHRDAVEFAVQNGATYWDWGFVNACRGGSMEAVQLMIEKGAGDWKSGLESACRGHQMEIVEMLVRKYAVDLNYCLFSVCKGGYTEAARIVIENGATDLDWGLMGACEGGHEDTVLFMIEKGAVDWNWALYAACQRNHMSIVQLMVQKGAARCRNCHKSAREHLTAKPSMPDGLLWTE
jgi:hypothetical protein